MPENGTTPEDPGSRRKETPPRVAVVSLFGDDGPPEQPPMSDAVFLERLRDDGSPDPRPIGHCVCPLDAAVMAATLLRHPFERVVRFRHQAQYRGAAGDVVFWEEALHQLVLITSPSDTEED